MNVSAIAASGAGAQALVLLAPIFVAGLGSSLVMAHVRAVDHERRVAVAWRDLAAELRSRHELVGRLVDVVQATSARSGYAIGAVTSAYRQAVERRTRPPDDRRDAEVALGRAVQAMLNAARRHPRLLASEDFLTLRQELARCEERIAEVRRRYNDALRGRGGHDVPADTRETEISGEDRQPTDSLW